MARLRQLASAALPQTCLLCAQPAQDLAPICCDCEKILPVLSGPVCPCCALPITVHTPSETPLCGHCLRIKRGPPFDATYACYSYTHPADRLIQALKFRACLALAPYLAAHLSEQLRMMRSPELPLPDALIPVPLHPERMRERGYNQAMETARQLGKLWGIPVWADVCSRRLNNPPQASLPYKARLKNLRGIFQCTNAVADRRVALIDDVMTTGATLTELAQTLKAAGAARVENWVIARASGRR